MVCIFFSYEPKGLVVGFIMWLVFLVSPEKLFLLLLVYSFKYASIKSSSYGEKLYERAVCLCNSQRTTPPVCLVCCGFPQETIIMNTIVNGLAIPLNSLCQAKTISRPLGSKRWLSLVDNPKQTPQYSRTHCACMYTCTDHLHCKYN